MLSVYITCASEKEAEKIALALVKEKLAACANIFPVKSVYEWNGKMQKQNEWALILKTTEAKYAALEKRAKQLHSYAVPCIVATKIAKAHAPYGQWAKNQAR